jgi:hypothetical protein
MTRYCAIHAFKFQKMDSEMRSGLFQAEFIRQELCKSGIDPDRHYTYQYHEPTHSVIYTQD